MPLKQIDMPELLAQFDTSVHDQLRRIAEMPGTTHLVVFENNMIGSRECGERTAVRVGPACTLKTLEQAAGQHLKDVPSQRQYAAAYVEITETG